MTESLEITTMGVTVTAEFEYNPPERGARERGSGVQLEPDYPASVEDVIITIDGEDITDIVVEKFMDNVVNEILSYDREPDGGY